MVGPLLPESSRRRQTLIEREIIQFNANVQQNYVDTRNCDGWHGPKGWGCTVACGSRYSHFIPSEWFVPNFFRCTSRAIGLGFRLSSGYHVVALASNVQWSKEQIGSLVVYTLKSVHLKVSKWLIQKNETQQKRYLNVICMIYIFSNVVFNQITSFS